MRLFLLFSHPRLALILTCTRTGLLYRVAERGGVITEQLVVPRPYISKVLLMAHTHVLGAHLGMDKTRGRILDRFYWPGIKKDVTVYCPETLDPKSVDPDGHYRGTLRPAGTRHCGASPKIQPGPLIYISHGGLCHPLPGSPAPLRRNR